VRVSDGVREFVRVSVLVDVIVAVRVLVALGVKVFDGVRVLVLVVDRVRVPVPRIASVVALNESVNAV
jgi:hypothetical protein